MFSKRYLNADGDPGIRNKSRQEKGEVALQQRRYGEQTIRDAKDFVQHGDDIHVNSVEHDYASKPGDWEWLSYHRYLKQSECWVQKTNPTYRLLLVE